MKKALNRIEYVKNEVYPRVVSEDAHYLMKSFELLNMLLISELFLKTSIMRKETRAGHFREDYPERDDAHWLKWIMVKQQGEKILYSAEQVPFDKYKFKPTRYYMDNFKFI